MRRNVEISLIATAGVIAVLVAGFAGGWFADNNDSGPVDDERAVAIEVLYPSDGSVFPPDFVAPMFLWRDPAENATEWEVAVTFETDSPPMRLRCAGDRPPPGEIDPACVAETDELPAEPTQGAPRRSWTPSDDMWAQIKARAGGGGVTVTISGVSADEALSRGQVSIRVSDDPVAAPIFYRDVPLMPSETIRGVIKPLARTALPLITWRLRDVSRPDSKVVMRDMPSCATCHTFSADGKTLGMDIEIPGGDKGAYVLASVQREIVIESDDLLTRNSFPGRPAGHKTIGLGSHVSPDGRHVVSTVNESVYVANFTDYEFLQVFYPTRGILAVHSRQTGQTTALPGADDPAYVHCNATWSPDGNTLVFARAAARDPYPAGRKPATHAGDPNETPIQYDLYRIAFNDGKGGQPEPIEGASGNGMSNSFPKVSPDGRWIVFVQCRNGQLMRPDSRLWIVPTAGGKAREMNCNTSRMNSWHSFSPNGRWLVFSSKANTPYTQMFLTHIDKAGNDSPAILIPNATAANRAVNIPEFANIAYDDLAAIDVPAVDYRRFENAGRLLLEQGRPAAATGQLRKAAAAAPRRASVQYHLGNALWDLNRIDDAIECYRKALAIDPDHLPAQLRWANALVRQGKAANAIGHFEKVLAVAPDRVEAHNNLGIALLSLNKTDAAVEHFQKTIAIVTANGDPDYYGDALFVATRNLGNAWYARRQYDRAIECYRKALAIDPKLVDARLNWGNCLFHQKQYRGAAEQFGKVLAIQPANADAHKNLGVALRLLADYDAAIIHLTKAVELRPNDLAGRFRLASTMIQAGRHAQAITQLERILQSAPEDPTAMKTLASLLATSSDAAIRDGKRAVALAQRACHGPGQINPVLLEALAAAYAEAGRFPEAIATAEKAIQLLPATAKASADALRQRLALYRQGKPFRMAQ